MTEAGSLRAVEGAKFTGGALPAPWARSGGLGRGLLPAWSGGQPVLHGGSGAIGDGSGGQADEQLTQA